VKSIVVGSYGLERSSMMFTVDLIALPDVPPGFWYVRCLATQAGRIPGKVHLLPSDPDARGCP
jgi:hypothetical protein